jgi:hypothetical protein
MIRQNGLSNDSQNILLFINNYLTKKKSIFHKFVFFKTAKNKGLF